MKKLSVLLVVVLIFVAGCSEGNMTAWILGGTDVDSSVNEYVGRIGYENDGVEVGGQSTWVGTQGAGQSYGAYIIAHIPAGPDILGQPYIGYQASVVDAEDGAFYGPIAGTIYEDLVGVDWVVEGWYRDFTGPLSEGMDSNDQWKVFVGPRFRF